MPSRRYQGHNQRIVRYELSFAGKCVSLLLLEWFRRRALYNAPSFYKRVLLSKAISPTFMTPVTIHTIFPRQRNMWSCTNRGGKLTLFAYGHFLSSNISWRREAIMHLLAKSSQGENCSVFCSGCLCSPLGILSAAQDTGHWVTATCCFSYR